MQNKPKAKPISKAKKCPSTAISPFLLPILPNKAFLTPFRGNLGNLQQNKEGQKSDMKNNQKTPFFLNSPNLGKNHRLFYPSGRFKDSHCVLTCLLGCIQCLVGTACNILGIGVSIILAKANANRQCYLLFFPGRWRMRNRINHTLGNNSGIDERSIRQNDRKLITAVPCRCVDLSDAFFYFSANFPDDLIAGTVAIGIVYLLSAKLSTPTTLSWQTRGTIAQLLVL